MLLIDSLRTEGTLHEVKLARVWRHVTGPRPVAIMSAYLNPKIASPEENMARSKRLAADARSAGYGYFWLDGRWEDDKTKEVYEEASIFIVGEADDEDGMDLFDWVVRMVGRYGQDAGFWSPPSSPEGYVVFGNGNKQAVGNLRMDRIGKIWSQLKTGPHRGRAFKFETTSFVTLPHDSKDYAKPRTFSEALARQAIEESGKALW